MLTKKFFTFWNVKNLKCKNFLIDFPDVLGNFKQKILTLQNVNFFYILWQRTQCRKLNLWACSCTLILKISWIAFSQNCLFIFWFLYLLHSFTHPELCFWKHRVWEKYKNIWYIVRLSPCLVEIADHSIH